MCFGSKVTRRAPIDESIDEGFIVGSFEAQALCAYSQALFFQCSHYFKNIRMVRNSRADKTDSVSSRIIFFYGFKNAFGTVITEFVPYYRRAAKTAVKEATCLYLKNIFEMQQGSKNTGV
jgi:hypothetical protein